MFMTFIENNNFWDKRRFIFNKKIGNKTQHLNHSLHTMFGENVLIPTYWGSDFKVISYGNVFRPEGVNHIQKISWEEVKSGNSPLTPKQRINKKRKGKRLVIKRFNNNRILW